MPPRALKRNADNWWGFLDASISESDESLVLKSSGAAGLELPCLIHGFDKGEKILVTAVAVDTPTTGKDTLTVSRGFGGTTAVSMPADQLMVQHFYKDIPNEYASRIESALMALVVMAGRTDGVLRSSAETEFEVTAQDTPDLTVNVDPGAAVVSDDVAGRLAAQTLTFVAPVTNPRIDVIQIDQDGVATVVAGTEGGSPSAPSVSADNLKLAEVYLRVGATSIKDTDDSVNGHITDARVYV